MALLPDPTLILLDDHGLVRDGIERQLLTDFPAATIAYSGDSLTEALAVASATTIDCAVVDLDLGDETPVAETVSAFTARRIPVVVVSAMARPDVLQAAIAAGASAFVAKRSSLRSLTTAVRTVLDGGTWIPPDLAGAVLRTSTSVDLSAQEKRALVLYASGLTLEMVARRMEITPNTVKHYLDRVRDKYTAAGITARTKVQLNQVARSEGLLP
jgi:two-component system, NarL family, nitrate/nitrite response regulator NarL